VPADTTIEDVDVAAERTRVEQGGDKDNVRILNLRKVYAPKGGAPIVAVDDFVLGLPAGSCFGLLGVSLTHYICTQTYTHTHTHTHTHIPHHTTLHYTHHANAHDLGEWCG
jgi:hypothetical protein